MLICFGLIWKGDQRPWAFFFCWPHGEKLQDWCGMVLWIVVSRISWNYMSSALFGFMFSAPSSFNTGDEQTHWEGKCHLRK